MAFCQYCGSQMPDDSKFCPNCGATIDDNIENRQATAFQPNENMNDTHQEMPMNWYKFLIYFALFLGAVSNAFTGIRALTGAQYGDSSSLVYAYFSSLKTIDIIMGIACLALAVFAIIVRQRLAQMKSDGPKLLLVLYGANVVITVVYILFVMMVVGSQVISLTDILPSIVTSIVMIFINKKYFDNRKHLFIH